MLAARGAAEVALVDVNEAGLVETARLVEAAGARASVHRLDLSDVAATETWFQAHGDVDILHNNAGVVSGRSEEHTSELQSLMRISYAVFCLKKNNNKPNER